MNHRHLLPFFSLLAAALLCWACTDARAQQPSQKTSSGTAISLVLKDGRTIPATAFVMQGDVLLATQQVGAGSGQIGYPLATIERVEFPNPPQIAAATALLGQGKGADALAQIDPIVSYYASFKAVPGNWWLPAVLVKLDALTTLGRERDFDALLAELSRQGNSAQYADAIRVRTAESSLRRGQPDRAIPVFDELIKNQSDPGVSARAWVGKGQIALAAKDYDSALFAYLRVVVLYPNERAIVPAALLGSGRAFAGIDNLAKAKETLQELMTEYPQSTEAAAAKLVIEKIEHLPNKPAS